MSFSYNESLLKLDRFFNLDKKIKENIYNLVPRDLNSEDEVISYSDYLWESLKDIYNDLGQICKDINNDFVTAKYKQISSEAILAFTNLKLEPQYLEVFYQKYISNMDERFVTLVKKECVGYSIFFPFESLESIKTINEMLHFLHCYILNKEEYLQSCNVLKAKNNNYNCYIKVYGNPSPILNSIYESIPLDIDIGDTDIVGIGTNKIIMMIRDLGHALTIEITIDNDKCFVEYFVPKICDIDKVNSLKGVYKVSSMDVGTIGKFETTVDNLTNHLINLISNVPTDDDLKKNSR